MKQAIQFGAGNIGRGFIGALLSQSGYDVLFADVNQEMIDTLHAEKQYTVYITDMVSESFQVGPVSALHTADPILIEKIAESEVITTAVGLSILPKIAPVIARGIEERAARGEERTMHIIACENGVRASSRLEEEVWPLLSPQAREYSKEKIGFVDCSVDRIVPPVKMDKLSDVCVERFYEWNVDSTQLKGEIQIEGMIKVDNLAAFVERKLFTLNTGHAVLAYTGYIKGYDKIEVCVADPSVLSVVRGAMTESGSVLVQKFGLDAAGHAAYREKILKRFHNHHLGDKVDRIGRDPLRKLSAGDRLIAPLTGAYTYGLSVDNLLLGVGAALHYLHPQDPESVRLQGIIKKMGIAPAVEQVTGIPEGTSLNTQIEQAYKELDFPKVSILKN